MSARHWTRCSSATRRLSPVGGDYYFAYMLNSDPDGGQFPTVDSYVYLVALPGPLSNLRLPWMRSADFLPTVGDVLLDFPTLSEDHWQPDHDLEPSLRAARRREQIENIWSRRREDAIRYGRPIPDDPEDEEREYFGLMNDSAVLLHGSYKVLRTTDELARTGSALADTGEDLGSVDSAIGSLSCTGVPRQFDGRRLWLLGTLNVFNEPGDSEFRNVTPLECFEDLSGQPVVRWVGLTRAASLARSRWTLYALTLLRRDVATWGVNEPLLAALAAIHGPQSAAELELGLQDDLRRRVREAVGALMSSPPSIANRGERRPELPAPRLVKGADAAEDFAAEFLAALGFRNVRRTPKGTDGGVDVIGDEVVAQVKFEALPTGRPAMQALYGVSVLERKAAVFFSLAGYSPQALAWAERAEIACFEFEADGSIAAKNVRASGLLDGAARTP